MAVSLLGSIPPQATISSQETVWLWPLRSLLQIGDGVGLNLGGLGLPNHMDAQLIGLGIHVANGPDGVEVVGKTALTTDFRDLMTALCQIAGGFRSHGAAADRLPRDGPAAPGCHRC